MLKKIIGSKSIVFAWSLSYFLVLLIPIASQLITNIVAEIILRNEINMYNKAALVGIAQSTDNLIYDVERLSAEVMYNQQVQDMLSLSPKDVNMKRFEMATLSKELKRILTANKGVEEIYLYYSKTDYVLSSLTSNPYDIFYSNELRNKFYGGDIKIFSDTNNNGQCRVFYEDNDKQPYGRRIIYTRTFFDISNSQEYLNIHIVFHENELFNPISMELTQKGTLFILDKENNVISAKGEFGGYEDIKYENLSKKEELLQYPLRKENVVLNYITLSSNGWKYVHVVKPKMFWSKLKLLRWIFILSVMLCLGGGIAIIYYAVKKQYGPVEALVNALEPKNKSKNIKSGNEYSLIENSINSILAENKQVYAKLYHQSGVFRTEILAKLIKTGDMGKFTFEDICNSFDLRFISDFFMVVMISIENISKIFFEDDYKDKIEDARIAEWIVVNVAEELLNKNHYGIVITIDGTLVCLVNCKNNAIETAKEDILDTLNQIDSVIRDNFNIFLFFAVSEVHKGIDNLSSAYYQASEVFAHKMLLPDMGIVHYDYLEKNKFGDYYYPIEMEMQLINCVKCGDFERSSDIIERIFKRNFDDEVLPIAMAQCLMFDVISTMVKTTGEVNKLSDSNVVEAMNVLETLKDCDSIAIMKQEIINFLELVCSFISKKNKEHNSAFSDEISAFIEKHYHDSGLNINMIADNFDKNATYISRRFKEQTSIGVLDYIHQVRIDHAKELFAQSNITLTVEQVSQMSGYSNTKTFNRIFTKVVGITPGEYKKIRN